jgi:hypothetical protein
MSDPIIPPEAEAAGDALVDAVRLGVAGDMRAGLERLLDGIDHGPACLLGIVGGLCGAAAGLRASDGHEPGYWALEVEHAEHGVVSADDPRLPHYVPWLGQILTAHRNRDVETFAVLAVDGLGFADDSDDAALERGAERLMYLYQLAVVGAQGAGA